MAFMRSGDRGDTWQRAAISTSIRQDESVRRDIRLSLFYPHRRLDVAFVKLRIVRDPVILGYVVVACGKRCTDCSITVLIITNAITVPVDCY